MAQLSVRKLALTFTLISLGLAAIYGALSLFGTAPGKAGELYDLFHMDREANVPTWYTSALLLGSSICGGLVALYKGRDLFWRHWWGLSALFAYLSLDETASLHERWEYIYQPWAELGGAFERGWVIPAVIVVVIVGAIYLRFFLHLPGRVKRYFFIGAALYVAGAVGGEMLHAYLAESQGLGTVTGIIALFEETMELLGVNSFLYALFLQLKLLPDKRLEWV